VSVLSLQRSLCRDLFRQFFGCPRRGETPLLVRIFVSTFPKRLHNRSPQDTIDPAAMMHASPSPANNPHAPDQDSLTDIKAQQEK
jgi:hypothetical protein